MSENIVTPEQQARYKNQKINQKPSQFIKELGCQQLLEFSEEIYSYKFKDKPNYGKLRFMLTKELLKQEELPDDIFDWNKLIKLTKPKEEFKVTDQIINMDQLDDTDEYKVFHKKINPSP